MRRFQISKTDYDKMIPKIVMIYSGDFILHRGVALLWNKKMIILIRPINER